jgi:predicted secreted protein
MSNKKRVRGEQLYMFLGDDYKPVGCSTDCSLSASVDTIEVSASGEWRNFRAGKKTWSIDCSGFYVRESTTPVNALRGVLAIGATVRVVMTALARELAEAGIDTDNLSPDGTHTIVGDAVITNCRYAGKRGELATYAISFLGSGALLPVGREFQGFPYALPIVF